MSSAQVALGVAGLLIGVPLSILGLIPDKTIVADPLSNGNSVVRLGIGLLPERLNNNISNAYYDQDFGGILPDIVAFNDNRQRIGSSRGSGKVGQGQWVNIEIHQNGTGRYQQPTSLELRGNLIDAVCIASLMHTWSDGMKVGMLGDMAEFCGQRWYYSSYKVPLANGGTHEPKCAWFGGNGTHQFPFGMRIHTPSFGRLTGGDSNYRLPDNPASLCWLPNMEWLTTPAITSSAPNRRSPFYLLQVLVTLLSTIHSHPVALRDLQARAGGPNTSWNSTLIISHHSSHSATHLCSHPGSWGPDFISKEEQLFCDMTTRKIWPLCDAGNTKHCYDAAAHILVDGKLRKREMKYAWVTTW